MSEPSYRINTERTWSSGGFPWSARIARMTDGEMIAEVFGDDEPGALAAAQSYIRFVNGKPDADGGVYFASETGEITEGAAA